MAITEANAIVRSRKDRVESNHWQCIGESIEKAREPGNFVTGEEGRLYWPERGFSIRDAWR
jgi:hypothetical protein